MVAVVVIAVELVVVAEPAAVDDPVVVSVTVDVIIQ